MKNKFLTALLATALLPLFHAHSGQYKDGPFIAFPSGGDVQKEKPGGGWQAAYEYNDLFSIETIIAGQTDDVKAMVSTVPLDADMELNILSMSFTGRLGWFFDPIGFFLGAGGGYYFFDADTEASSVAVDASRSSLPPGVVGLELATNIEDAIGYHLSVGAEWLITGTWELFAEYRHVFLETDIRYNVTETRIGAPSPETTFTTTRTSNETLSYDHGLVRIGLNYRF